MKKLRISIKEFITFYSINNLYKAKIPVYRVEIFNLGEINVTPRICYAIRL